jgi:hypothetical protein
MRSMTWPIRAALALALAAAQSAHATSATVVVPGNIGSIPVARHDWHDLLWGRYRTGRVAGIGRRNHRRWDDHLHEYLGGVNYVLYSRRSAGWQSELCGLEQLRREHRRLH